MAINKTKISQDVFLEFFNLINGNISNPKAGSPKWIFSDMPDNSFSKSSAGIPA